MGPSLPFRESLREKDGKLPTRSPQKTPDALRLKCRVLGPRLLGIDMLVMIDRARQRISGGGQFSLCQASKDA